MWTYLTRKILRNRLQILIVIGAITSAMAFFASDIKLSYENSSVLPANDSTRIIYENFKKQFGEDGSVMFIGFSDKDLFRLDKFRDLYLLSEDLKNTYGVEEVVSLTRSYRLVKNDSTRKFDFLPLCERCPSTQAEVDSLKKTIYSLPFYDNLIINRKTGATLVMITLDKNLMNTKDRIRIIKDIKTRLAVFSDKYKIDTYLSGLPYIRTVTAKMLQNEMILFTFLSILVAAIFLFIFFRSFKAVIYPVIIVITSVIWAMGMMSLFGYKITMLTAIIPPLLIVIGVENCIFLLNKYHFEYRLHRNKVKSLSRVIQRIGNANLLTNAATATGFAAFVITNNRIMVEFGAIAAINIMVVFALSLTLVPIFFSYLPPPKTKDIRHQEESIAKAIIDKAVNAVTYHRKLIYIILGVMILAGAAGVVRLKVSGRVVDDIAKKDKIYTDLMFFEKNFKGIMPLEISIDTRKRKGVFNLGTLNKIDRLQDTLATYPQLARPLSIVEVLKYAKQAFYAGDTSFYSLPNSSEITFMGSYIPQMKTKKRTLMNNFLDTNFQVTRVSVQMANIRSAEIDSIHKSLKPKVDSIFNPAKYNVIITGSSIVFQKGTDFLIRNLFESILLAVVVIALLLAFLFTSWRMILISLIPNLIPQLMTGALMGVLEIPIKPSTILIFSIALGISVDNSIQFLSRYRLQLKHSNRNIPFSVISALKETGYSMIYSSTVLFFGFGIFALSSFGGTQAVGFLVSFTLLVAGLLNLFILPSLLLTLDKWSTTKGFEKPILEFIPDDTEEIEKSSKTE